jgi:hypothetical protein
MPLPPSHSSGGGSFPDKVIVGVYALSRGAGATYTAIALSEFLVSKGSTALIVLDGKQDINFASFDRRIDRKIPEPYEKLKAIQHYENEYDYLVLDFGSPFNVLPTGLPYDSFATDDSDGSDDPIIYLNYCDRLICLTFSASWHVGKKRYLDATKLSRNSLILNEEHRSLNQQQLVELVFPEVSHHKQRSTSRQNAPRR